MIVGLNPSENHFDQLLPWFSKGFDDGRIKKAFSLCFNNLILSLDEKDVQNITSLLLRCLASIVYHRDKLKNLISLNPKHPFHKIPILNDNELLSILKTIVTINPSHVLSQPTVSPLSVQLVTNQTMQKVFEHMGKCLTNHGIMLWIWCTRQNIIY